MIVMFIGPSGSGKDFFYTRVLNKYEFNKIIMYSTRPKREGEINGREYYFVDMKTMNELEEENKLIERRDYNTVNGVWSYATRGDIINLDENYLVINTWEGYKKYLEFFGNGIIYPFYFALDDNTRFERAYLREQKNKTKNYLEMCRRFLADQKDFSKENIEIFNPTIIDNNGSIKDTDNQIDKHIKLLLKR